MACLNILSTFKIKNSLNDNFQFYFSYDALNRSLYYEHMKMWLKYFPLSQFHIVNGDRLIKKPWHEVIRVEKFLGVDHQVDWSLSEILKIYFDFDIDLKYILEYLLGEENINEVHMSRFPS